MKVKAHVVPVRALSEENKRCMFTLMDTYYDGVDWERFQTDLMEKTDVILLIDSKREEICGFSTLLWKPMEVDGTQVIAVFSGDTILDKKYWGSPALGIRFLIYLFNLKLMNPSTPVYWFLISKGYKTYLLMANNFRYSYPHWLRATPPFEKKLMDAFYSERWKEEYRPEAGVISFSNKETCRLKAGVAPISQSMNQRSPEIAFFESINPNWQQGDELACIAKMTLDMPLRYALKKVLLRKGHKRTKVSFEVSRPPLPMGNPSAVSMALNGIGRIFNSWKGG